MTEKDDLRALVSGINGFSGWTHADRIRLFAWVQHSLRKKDRFISADVKWCYTVLSYKPTNVSQYLSDMEGKELLKDSNGYYLEAGFRSTYDERYGEHDITLSIRQLVKELPDKIPDLAEKDFMKEALICLRHDAGRAAIIMAWSIAFYHLCSHVLKHKLTDFNSTYPTRYPRKWQNSSVQVITKYEDFAVDLSEREVIEICNSANIIAPDVYKILVEKLGKRNTAAHPSTIHVNQIHAEAYIDELIRNVVLVLPA